MGRDGSMAVTDAERMRIQILQRFNRDGLDYRLAHTHDLDTGGEAQGPELNTSQGPSPN